MVLLCKPSLYHVLCYLLRTWLAYNKQIAQLRISLFKFAYCKPTMCVASSKARDPISLLVARKGWAASNCFGQKHNQLVASDGERFTYKAISRASAKQFAYQVNLGLLKLSFALLIACYQQGYWVTYHIKLSQDGLLPWDHQFAYGSQGCAK